MQSGISASHSQQFLWNPILQINEIKWHFFKQFSESKLASEKKISGILFLTNFCYFYCFAMSPSYHPGNPTSTLHLVLHLSFIRRPLFIHLGLLPQPPLRFEEDILGDQALYTQGRGRERSGKKNNFLEMKTESKWCCGDNHK